MNNKRTVYGVGYLNGEEAETAWKIAKSLHILELAEKWKDRLDTRVYVALVERANSV